MTMLIHNVNIFTNNANNSLLKNHAVLIEGSRIAAVGEEKKLLAKNPAAEKLDGEGRLLMPGLINAHNHFYGTFARGISLSGTPKNFHEILQMLWWKLDRALDAEGVYYSTLVPGITAVKRGVTTIIDHHASPNALEGSLDEIEKAMALLGLRGLLCYEVTNRDGKMVARNGIAENARYIRKCAEAKKENPDHLFDGMMGLHASFTIANDTLASAVTVAKDLDRGCHIHVLEDSCDRELTRKQYGADIIQRLRDSGVLSDRSIAAHGIFLSPAEMDILAETDTISVHNPQSNMNNAVGRADIFTMLEKNILLGIGTDGMSGDIWPDVRSANLLHKHHLNDANVGWMEIAAMTLKNNPAIYQRLTGQAVGMIAEDYLADIILIDYHPPTPLSGDNIWGHCLFGIADAPVNTTIINGRVVMHNKQLIDIDEAEVAAKSREVAGKVWERFQG